MTQAQDTRSEEARLEMYIEARLCGRVHGFRIVRRDNGFVLQGRTRTYYAKQLVLHAALQVTALPILANEIEVGGAVRAGARVASRKLVSPQG